MSVSGNGPSSFTVNKDRPYLTIRHPECTQCYSEVHIEDADYAICETCNVTWDRIEEGIEAETPDEVCGFVEETTRSAYDYEGEHWEFGDPEPCILGAGHNGQHRCPYRVTVTKIESDEGASPEPR